MKTLDDFLRQAAKNGEVRSGIVLGLRMAMAGARELNIPAPRAARRSLVVIVETDRCLPDAVELVTGCRLGNRTLKFRDLGKMAATFVDLKTMRAVRLAARESANMRAGNMYPHFAREDALRKGYQELPLHELFSRQWVKVALAAADIPGYRAPRVICEVCEEGVSFGKHIRRNNCDICQSCAGPAYFETLSGHDRDRSRLPNDTSRLLITDDDAPARVQTHHLQHNLR